MIMWQHVLAVFVVRLTLNALWGCCNVYLHLIALGPTQHYTFLWVDRFSKAVHFTSLEKLTTATETAKLLTHHVFRLHGISTKIVSDQGSQLISQVWKTFCFALSAKVCVSSGFHLQIPGQLERLNKELETPLRCVTFQNPSSWSSQLTLLGYTYNSLTSSATSFSPFEAFLGYQPPLFPLHRSRPHHANSTATTTEEEAGVDPDQGGPPQDGREKPALCPSLSAFHSLPMTLDRRCGSRLKTFP